MSDTRAATDGRFVGDDVANDGAKIAGCSAKGAPESPQGGVEGSNPSRSTNILPCPFCGGAASVEEIEGAYGARFSVGCSADEADCMGYQSLTTFARQREAIEAWNRRSNADVEIWQSRWKAERADHETTMKQIDAEARSHD